MATTGRRAADLLKIMPAETDSGRFRFLHGDRYIVSADATQGISDPFPHILHDHPSL
jgi:hypothetical protein